MGCQQVVLIYILTQVCAPLSLLSVVEHNYGPLCIYFVGSFSSIPEDDE